MTRPTEHKPATVPMAQQAGEVPSRWRWVKPWAWTLRTLTILEQGIEGGKWFRLFDKVFSERNLWAAFQQVASKGGAAGVDHVSVTQFERGFPETIWEVSDQLKHGTYQPQSIRRVHIPKPGTNETRPLGIPTVRDRTVQAAVVNVIEPIYDRNFAEHSYGFRPGRGCKDALRRVDRLLKRGYTVVVDADLKGYFDSIPHDGLKAEIHELTSRRWLWTTVEDRVAKLNRKLLGWSNYFYLGPVSPAYRAIDRHARHRLRQWLRGKHKVRSRGTTRFPDARLHDEFGLIRLSDRPRSFPWAKA